jgi:hypothetical protein
MPEHKTGKQRENRRIERKEKQKGRKQKKNFIPICYTSYYKVSL